MGELASFISGALTGIAGLALVSWLTVLFTEKDEQKNKKAREEKI